MAFHTIASIRDAMRRAATLLSIALPVRPLVGPIMATLEVSSRCNFACLMCPHHSPLAGKPGRPQTDFMDMAVAARAIEGAAQMGSEIVTLSGTGEPLLNPNLLSMVRLATRHGLRPQIFTNGSLLTRRRMEELIDAGLARLAVSLVAASPESYARCHPGTSPETFRRILDSLASFQRLKSEAGACATKLDLHFIAVEGFHREIEQMVDVGIALGAGSMHITTLRNRAVGEIDTLAPSQEEERLAVDRLRELAPKAAKAGLTTNLDELAIFQQFGPVSHLVPCYAGWFDTLVQIDGTVSFCARCTRTMGNVVQRPLADIWLGPEYQAVRRLFRSPLARTKVGNCACNRCCHFVANWRVARRLAPLRLAPRIKSSGNGYTPSCSPRHGEPLEVAGGAIPSDAAK